LSFDEVLKNLTFGGGEDSENIYAEVNVFFLRKYNNICER
jgi:hypothetical protein